MKRGVLAALALPLAFGLAGCGEDPVGPARLTAKAAAPSFQAELVRGTGLVLENVTGLPLGLGDVVVRQAVVKEFGIVEDVAAGIIQLEARGVLEATGGVLGTNVVTEDFTARVGIVSTGSGQCDVVEIDPAPLEVDILGDAVEVDLPVTEVGVRGGGAVGNLLCVAGRLLSPVTRGASRAAQSIVNAINNLLI